MSQDWSGVLLQLLDVRLHGADQRLVLLVLLQRACDSRDELCGLHAELLVALAVLFQIL
jgi:hypothetical protein